MATITDAIPDMQRELRFFPIDNPTPRHLSRTHIRQFNELGYIHPLDIFTPAEAAANRAYFDQLMAQAAERGFGNYAINGWHRFCQGIYDLVVTPRILDVVQDLLGENLICWGTHYFCKLPHDTKRVAWHQDASYWPLTPSKTVTVWLAIDDVDLANGAMKVIPRSHLHGQIPFVRSAVEEENVLDQSVVNVADYGDTPVPMVMRAGQISLHSDLLVHGSEPNPSDRRRCGLTMRFVPPEVHGRWNGGILARGTDTFGHWQIQPRPQGDHLPERRA